ncbi:MAG: ornithine cyclodeaminase family protein [Chloroflexi bacterium]|nr:ornithine cyclodeaminase family protein [Chloroflexota bacterium]
MTSIRLLSKRDLEQVLTLSEVIKVVEEGFAAEATGTITTFPVVMEHIPAYSAFFGIKSGYVPSTETLGLKAAGFWPPPKDSPIPGHFAVILLLDGETGALQSFMDGNLITTMRTGAAGAVAAKYLARPESNTMGLIGAGVQGRIQVQGLSELFELSEVRVWDKSREAVARYMEAMSGQGFVVRPVDSPQEAVSRADIIVTATPSTRCLVDADWVAAGTHVNAIGADARGKQENDPRLFTRAKVVVDKLSQCRELGDLQHPLRQGLIKESDVHAELGEIVAGKKAGRTQPEEITIFDATGVSFQDLVTARLAYERAVEAGLGIEFTLE